MIKSGLEAAPVSLMTANSPGPELRTATLMVMILYDDDGDDGDDDDGDDGDDDGGDFGDGDGDGIIIHDQLIHSRQGRREPASRSSLLPQTDSEDHEGKNVIPSGCMLSFVSSWKLRCRC